MPRILILAVTVALGGCGLDVAGTAATNAAASASEARQAQQTEAQVRQQVDAAVRLNQQQLDAAEKAANP
jgi:hypothetical protein